MCRREPEMEKCTYHEDGIVLQDKVPMYADQSLQYFSLLCFLLKKTQAEAVLSNAEARLTKEIQWLKNARVRSPPLGYCSSS